MDGDLWDLMFRLIGCGAAIAAVLCVALGFIIAAAIFGFR